MKKHRFNAGDFPHASFPNASAGFVLMEIMLALTIFSISVLGLVSALNDTLSVSNNLHRAQVIRAGLESILAEARQREEVEEMKLETTDQNKGITYRTEIEEVSIANESGEDLDGLYVLRATATYLENGQERQEKAEVYVNLTKEPETPEAGTTTTTTQAGAGTNGNTNAPGGNAANGNRNGGGNKGGQGNRGNGNNLGGGGNRNNGNGNNNNNANNDGGAGPPGSGPPGSGSANGNRGPMTQ